MMYTLTDEQIQQNKEDFLNILQQVLDVREGARGELLLKKLEESDFFTAPASAKYHGSYKGGLCDHSLSVYYNLCSLIKQKHLEDVISNDSAIIVALFHDFSKRNLYETYVQNKKVYSEIGTKKDEMGKFDWVAMPGYKVKDAEDRFIFGNHEQTAEYMISQFIPLTCEESVAIINHHAGMSWDSTKSDISVIYDRYPLACLLHIADMMSTFVDKA